MGASKLGRRKFLTRSTAVGVAASVSAVVVPGIAGATPSKDVVVAPPPDGTEISALGLWEGMRLGDYEILSVRQIPGFVVVDVGVDWGPSFRLDVFKRGRTGAAVADSKNFSVYVNNDGKGSERTDERVGQGAIFLAHYLDARDPASPSGLLTHAQRLRKYPDRSAMITARR